MVGNVSSLLKTVKSVEDKALRGTRALESTIDAVKQAVLVSWTTLFSEFGLSMSEFLFVDHSGRVSYQCDFRAGMKYVKRHFIPVDIPC